MQKKSAKHKSKIRNLAVIATLSAIILTVSTYAWFIGLDEVHVTTFNVEIAATDSLSLSLDAGETWETTITIDPDTIETIYTGNTNSWTGTDPDTTEFIGLIPMSSVGEMDPTSSRMVLYEKSSLSAVPPLGTRLMTSRVNNFETGDEEVNGYIAFDLFIRNETGADYRPGLDITGEEAIYLLDESAVDVVLTGEEEGGTTDAAEDAVRSASGIENSIRVAFAQIGRVIGTTEGTEGVETIAGITCTSAADVTGICRTATIWEPNDTAHTDGAINYYNLNCGFRETSAGDTPPAAPEFNAKGCYTIADGDFVPTFAANSAIASSDNVNIYDGVLPEAINGFTTYNSYASKTITGGDKDGEDMLVPVDTFTDTEKVLNDGLRPAFMYLEANSITKVRVYIYLEGQDIDNYDWAIEGKQISVNFGFSKQIYETP